MSLKKITIEIERETWKRFKLLKDDNGKPNAIFNLRRAMDMYLKILELEEILTSTDGIDKVFEDRESDEGIHATSSFGRATV